MPAAFATKEAELACSEMFISKAKWHVRAFQSLPWSPNAQEKRKSSLSKTTPTEKRAHTFRAFVDAPEQRSLPKAMLVIRYYSDLTSPQFILAEYWLSIACEPIYVASEPSAAFLEEKGFHTACTRPLRFCATSCVIFW